MTDKELLELAAKAAGIDPKWGSLYWQWNPLTDDGDDTVQLYGLTDENMDLLAKAVKIAREVKV